MVNKTLGVGIAGDLSAVCWAFVSNFSAAILCHISDPKHLYSWMI